MADKVVRLTNIRLIEATMRGDDVLLLITGKESGRDVRCEIALHTWAIGDVVANLRTSVKSQVDKWQRVQESIA